MSGLFGSFLNEVEGQMGTGQAGTDQHPQGALNMVSELIDAHGGVGGLIEKLNQGGLGAQVQDWASGTNCSALAGDIEQVFPPEQLEALAERHGIPAGMASQVLASILPQAVGQGTRNGTAGTQAADDGDQDASAGQGSDNG
jgi:uncharacterized protein YidB (DUF937 family)